MSLNRTLIFFLVLTSIAGWGLVWQQHRSFLSLQSSQDTALAERKSAWEKSLQEANKRSHQLESQLADLQKSSSAESNVPGNRAPASRPNVTARPGTNQFSSMMENPEFAKLWAAQQKSQLDGRYSALFKALKLGPADLDKFKDLLVEKQHAASDVLVAARAQGLNPRDNKDAFRALMTQNSQELENTLSRQLGPEKYAQYQQYEETLPQRNLANQLEQRLSYSSAPLQPAQMEQLVVILAQNSALKMDGPNTSPTTLGAMSSGRVGAKISDAAIAQAQTILDPTQLVALIQLKSEQQLQQQIAEVARAAARTANANQTLSSGVNAPAKAAGP